MKRLKPCPCCGGRPIIIEDYATKHISCVNCGLSTPRMAFGWKSFLGTAEDAEQAAADKWNRRVGDETN